MTAETYERDMGRALANCPGTHGIRCGLVRGHEGEHWSGDVESFLGMTVRCGAPMYGRFCFRARHHVGMHEDVKGNTVVRRKGEKS